MDSSCRSLRRNWAPVVGSVVLTVLGEASVGGVSSVEVQAIPQRVSSTKVPHRRRALVFFMTLWFKIPPGTQAPLR